VVLPLRQRTAPTAHPFQPRSCLYVTVKTVETHPSSTYRKLGVRSRRGLEPTLRSDSRTYPG
jgi:hypothetical protein